MIASARDGIYDSRNDTSCNSDINDYAKWDVMKFKFKRRIIKYLAGSDTYIINANVTLKKHKNGYDNVSFIGTTNADIEYGSLSLHDGKIPNEIHFGVEGTIMFLAEPIVYTMGSIRETNYPPISQEDVEKCAREAAVSEMRNIAAEDADAWLNRVWEQKLPATKAVIRALNLKIEGE